MFPAGAGVDEGGSFQLVVSHSGSAVAFLCVCDGCALELLPRKSKISKSLSVEQKPHSCYDPFPVRCEELSNPLTSSQQAVTCL